MKLFIQLFPVDVHISFKTFVLTCGLFVTALLPLMMAEGCVKRPSLEPTPGVAPQQTVRHVSSLQD